MDLNKRPGIAETIDWASALLYLGKDQLDTATVYETAGVILNAASIVALHGNFGQTNYVAAKAGVVGMTKVWARELGKKGIRVNAVTPGFIRTDMTASMPAEVLEGMRSHTPLGRLGEADDVAKLYVFLASDDAAFISGQVIGCDGGLVIGT